MAQNTRCLMALTGAVSVWLSACGGEDAPRRETGAPAAVTSPVEFVMRDRNGERIEVRLAEVNPPSGDAWPVARARLDTLLAEADGGLELIFTGEAHADRYERALAHAEYEGEEARVWIQGVMVSEGLLMAASRADNRARAAELLRLEGEARAAGRGFWGSGDFAVRDPDPNALAQHLDSFQIVEGRVIDVGNARSGRAYLNFGLDWRSDFTVSVQERDLSAFEEAGLDLESLAGRTVRVRGWLYRENGPMMAVDHPEAIEILE